MMRKMILCVAAVALLSSGAFAASITAVGDTVQALSADGSYATGKAPATNPDWGQVPYQWSAGTGMVKLENKGSGVGTGIDVLSGGALFGGANAGGVTNDAGAFIGRYMNPTLGTLSPSSECLAAAYNAATATADGTDAWLVGEATKTTQAIRWKRSDLANPQYVSGVSGEFKLQGVASDGSAVGQDRSGVLGKDAAVYWDGTNSPVTIPGLDASYNRGQGKGISNNGQFLTGYSYSPIPTDAYHGFRWSPGDAAPTDLSPMAGDWLSFGWDAADDGTVVGWSYGANSYEAALWSPNGNGVLIKNILAFHGVDMSGWQSLYKATTVSADGLTVGGYGFLADGTMSGWVAEVPEPGTISFLVLGGLALLRRRR